MLHCVPPRPVRSLHVRTRNAYDRCVATIQIHTAANFLGHVNEVVTEKEMDRRLKAKFAEGLNEGWRRVWGILFTVALAACVFAFVRKHYNLRQSAQGRRHLVRRRDAAGRSHRQNTRQSLHDLSLQPTQPPTSAAEAAMAQRAFPVTGVQATPTGVPADGAGSVQDAAPSGRAAAAAPVQQGRFVTESGVVITVAP
jgi:hypothetical protein